MTYDQLQAAAPRLTCTVCQRDYFVAAKQIPTVYVCVECQGKAAQEAPRVQAERWTMQTHGALALSMIGVVECAKAYGVDLESVIRVLRVMGK